MRLTKVIRGAFIRSVMDDVPKAADHKEDIRAVVVKDYVDRLPTMVQRVWNNTETRAFIQTATKHHGGVSISIPSLDRWDNNSNLTEEAQAKVLELQKLDEESAQIYKQLQSKLYAVAWSVNTRKALAIALPEFEKYLPVDEAAALRTVPVVINVVNDFVKAGWPAPKLATA